MFKKYLAIIYQAFRTHGCSVAFKIFIRSFMDYICITISINKLQRIQGKNKILCLSPHDSLILARNIFREFNVLDDQTIDEIVVDMETDFLSNTRQLLG